MLSTAAIVLAAASTAAASGVLGWGTNSSGVLGNGNTTKVLRPTTSLQTESTSVVAGQNFGLALLSNGTVKAWGANSSGQLGNGTTTGSSLPVTVKGLSEVTAIAAHGSFALALLKNGTVKAWGANAYGQLGDTSTTNRDEPVTVGELTEVTAIAAGRNHSLALLGNGTVVAWGSNEVGQLGDGSVTGPEKCTIKEFVGEIEVEREAPCSRKPVSVSELSEVTAIAAGGDHTLALLSNGTVKAWGANGAGQLGNGVEGPESCEVIEEGETFTEPCSRTPVMVSELSEVTAIAGGGAYSLALLSNKTVNAWGDNGSGQLGDGTTMTRTTPVAVHELEEVTAISAGSNHSLALLSNKTVKAWGSNSLGQLGTGNTTNSTVPVAVVDNQKAESVSSGFGNFSLSSGTPAGPIAESVKPSNGGTTGGTTVTIKGSNLSGATEVDFGEVATKTVTVVSETEITAVSPSNTKLGAVAITVVTNHGVSNGGPKFTYISVGKVELGRCEKISGAGTKYKTGTCTEELAAGKFEWLTGIPKTGFTGSGGASTFESTAKGTLKCTAESLKGNYAEPKQVENVIVKFTGCEASSAPGSKCSTAGAAEGEVVTNTLEGSFGRESTENNKVGLDLLPAGETSQLFNATCGTSSVQIRGSVIGLVTPVNKMTSTFTIKFKATKGKQAPEHLLEEPTDVLEMSLGGGPFFQTGLTLETPLNSEEELELNTVVV